MYWNWTVGILPGTKGPPAETVPVMVAPPPLGPVVLLSVIPDAAMAGALVPDSTTTAAAAVTIPIRPHPRTIARYLPRAWRPAHGHFPGSVTTDYTVFA
ncbi:hypothetical protein Ait01nite_060720 [Actinoplanes italicus]|nr:hypothetical protein Ait01nite_060720 [Actinoplanes italicus]